MMTGMEENKKTFRKELEGLINRHSMERAKTTAAHVRFDGPDGPEFYLCTRCGYNGLSPASHFCPSCGREINWGGACADSPAGENLS